MTVREKFEGAAKCFIDGPRPAPGASDLGQSDIFTELAAEIFKQHGDSPSALASALEIGFHIGCMAAHGTYVLDDNDAPVAELDLLTWAEWIGTAKRKVKETTIGSFSIATVFLGLDYSSGEGPPPLWETMVLDKGVFKNSPLDGEMEQYYTRSEAIQGHEMMCKRVESENDRLMDPSGPE